MDLLVQMRKRMAHYNALPVLFNSSLLVATADERLLPNLNAAVDPGVADLLDAMRVQGEIIEAASAEATARLGQDEKENTSDDQDRESDDGSSDEGDELPAFGGSDSDSDTEDQRDVLRTLQQATARIRDANASVIRGPPGSASSAARTVVTTLDDGSDPEILEAMNRMLTILPPATYNLLAASGTAEEIADVYLKLVAMGGCAMHQITEKSALRWHVYRLQSLFVPPGRDEAHAVFDTSKVLDQEGMLVRRYFAIICDRIGEDCEDICKAVLAYLYGTDPQVQALPAFRTSLQGGPAAYIPSLAAKNLPAAKAAAAVLSIRVSSAAVERVSVSARLRLRLPVTNACPDDSTFLSSAACKGMSGETDCWTTQLLTKCY